MFECYSSSIGTDYGFDPMRELSSLPLLILRYLRTNKVTMKLNRFERARCRMRRHKSLHVFHRSDQMS